MVNAQTYSSSSLTVMQCETLCNSFSSCMGYGFEQGASTNDCYLHYRQNEAPAITGNFASAPTNQYTIVTSSGGAGICMKKRTYTILLKYRSDNMKSPSVSMQTSSLELVLKSVIYKLIDPSCDQTRLLKSGLVPQMSF